MPLQTEFDRFEAAARVARPIGQCLHAAMSAMRKADARAAAASSALAAAAEKNDKAVEEQTACAVELAALEEELIASARDGQADDLAEAVEAALKNPAAAYSHATLQAAFVRYAENKDKEKDKARPPRRGRRRPGLPRYSAARARSASQRGSCQREKHAPSPPRQTQP